MRRVLFTLIVSLMIPQLVTAQGTILRLEGKNAPDAPSTSKDAAPSLPDKDFSTIELVGIPILYRASLRAKSFDEIEVQVARNFDQISRGSASLSKNERAKEELIKRARKRATVITRWLSYDLDGDAAITDDELMVFANQPLRTATTIGRGINTNTIMPSPEQSEQIFNDLKTSLKLKDLNGDGRMDLSEMIEQAEAQTGKTQRTVNSITKVVNLDTSYLAFDSNSDGRTHKTEFLAEMKKLFDGFDTNTDGALDLTELATLKRTNVNARAALRKK